jgi:hypothetical protein
MMIYYSAMLTAVDYTASNGKEQQMNVKLVRIWKEAVMA